MERLWGGKWLYDDTAAVLHNTAAAAAISTAGRRGSDADRV